MLALLIAMIFLPQIIMWLPDPVFGVG